MDAVVRASSAVLQEFVRGQPDVLDDLPENDRREVTRPMIRNRRLATVRMNEAESFKYLHSFSGFEDR